MAANDIDAKATEIRKRAQEFGLKVRARDGIVTVSGSFTPGDTDAYYKMEGDARSILIQFRQVRAGSIWGTDSGSVGGYTAIKTGNFVMNKSGCEMRLARKFE